MDTLFCGTLYNLHDVQMAGNRRLDSVKKYGKVEVAARKALLEQKVIRMGDSGTNLERQGER